LEEAERTLQRVANMMVERERSDLERAQVEEERAVYKDRGEPMENWPALPPTRGLSVGTGKAIISAVNAFIIAHRFSDERATKERIEELAHEVMNVLKREEGHRQRLAELVGR
jgi:hypothetical protein